MTKGSHNKDGAGLAAVLSAGIGCAVIGAATILAEAFPGFKEAVNWWNPAGPLTGKLGAGVVAWLLSWGVLHGLWKNRELAFRTVWFATVLLILAGWIGTFPPIFEKFSGH